MAEWTGRRRSSVDYDRLDPAAFRAALGGLSLQLGEFAELYGVSFGRAEKWAAGRESVPHQARVLLTLMTLPGALDLARAVTRSALEAHPSEETKT